MPTRVTNNLLVDRVQFNTQRSIARFLEMQEQMSTGRRIRIASDDPVGAVRGLNYRNELAGIEQWSKNIAQGLTWNNTYDSALADLSDILTTAKEIAVAMANDTYDNVARMAAANEVQSLFEQALQISNSTIEGRSIFGGFQTRDEPFLPASNGVTYRGDTGAMQFDIDNDLRATINSNGQDVFLPHATILGAEADLNVGVDLTTLLADLRGGDGLTAGARLIEIVDSNLGLTSTIDLSAATTLDDVIATINTQLVIDGITNVTAQLGAEGNNLSLVATANGLISGSTPIENLRGGLGIDMDTAAFQISDGAAIEFTVDLSGASTIGDIITAGNAALAANGVSNVSFGINATGTGVVITDSNGTPLGLEISEDSVNGKTAQHLGLVGSVGAQLDGGDLDPQPAFDVTDSAGVAASELGIAGTFSLTRVGDDLNPQLLATTPLSQLANTLGLGTGEFTIWQGERRADISLNGLVTIQDLLDRINGSGLDVLAEINVGATGIQIATTDPTRSFVIESPSGPNLAGELGLFGSTDIMGSLLLLANSLRRNDSDGAGQMLQFIDDAGLHILSERATVGARTIRLETTNERLVDKELSFTELLSENEDADLPELITQLSTYEANYQAALLASARIIQPSLLDFLR